MNQQRPTPLGIKIKHARARRLFAALLPLPLLLGLPAGVNAQRNDDRGLDLRQGWDSRDHPPSYGDHSLGYKVPAAAGTSTGSRPPELQAHHDATGSAAATSVTVKTSSSNILPQVPETNLSQVPPVPPDPFISQPVVAAPPPAAGKPVTVGGFGETSVYEVNCVLPGGSYCSFTNSSVVAPGTICHCGSVAGTTE